MLFDEATLKSAGFSKKQIAHLKKRQDGGTSGASGYSYQRRYALLCALEAVLNNHHASVLMEALCPVDDVVIEGTTVHVHAQCKQSSGETWTKTKKKLTKEFSQQAKLLERAGASFRLELVVTDAAQRDRLHKKRPERLKSVIDVVHFARAVPEHQPWAETRMARALDALLPVVLRGPSHREELYKEVNHQAGEPWQPATAGALITQMALAAPSVPVVLPAGLRPPWSVTPADWQAVHNLLSQIPGLTIETSGDVCVYRHGFQSGLVARCDTPAFARFARSVVASKPTTMEDFMKVLP
jgi:hypothetical protein